MTSLSLSRLSSVLLLVTSLRALLGVTVLGVALVRDASDSSILLAFAAATVLMAFVLLNDPRRRLRARRGVPPGPGAADVEPLARSVIAALFPSTVTVSVLAVVALATDRDVLAGLLGGVLAGMGAASLVAAARLAGRDV